MGLLTTPRGREHSFSPVDLKRIATDAILAAALFLLLLCHISFASMVIVAAMHYYPEHFSEGPAPKPYPAYNWAFGGYDEDRGKPAGVPFYVSAAMAPVSWIAMALYLRRRPNEVVPPLAQ